MAAEPLADLDGLISLERPANVEVLSIAKMKLLLSAGNLYERNEPDQPVSNGSRSTFGICVRHGQNWLQLDVERNSKAGCSIPMEVGDYGLSRNAVLSSRSPSGFCHIHEWVLFSASATANCKR
jgi:hypothetical protein